LNDAAPGDGGGMVGAGAPRATAADFTSFFYGNNATISPRQNAAMWKAQVDLFTRPDLGGGPASGQDPLAVESLRVDRVIVP
jgi:hypothetical protein